MLKVDKMTENYFESVEFKTSHMNMCVESWYDQFHGIDYGKPFDEVFYLSSNVEEVEKYISVYHEKYGTELKYRLDGIYYWISQIK